MASYSSDNLADLDFISISSIAAMFSGREQYSNISPGYTASVNSVNSSDSSSSIISITEYESSIPLVNSQVNQFEDDMKCHTGGCMSIGKRRLYGTAVR